MSKLTYLSFILFLFITSIFSLPFNPLEIKSANYSIIEKQTISMSHGSAINITIQFPIPKNSKIVDASTHYTIVNDSDGNSYLRFFYKSPPMPFSYFFNISYNANQQHVNQLPDNYTIPKMYKKYLTPTTNSKAEQKIIRELAENITLNSKTDFEKISALALWVNKNVEYNLSAINYDFSAIDILNKKYGVCEDYTLLFVSLARELGYPARFVSGYSYSEDSSAWLGHSWAEVYIGKWISVDATWLEVANLDATHIPYTKSVNSTFASTSVSAFVEPVGAKIKFSKSNPKSSIASNIYLNSVQYITDFNSIKHIASTTPLPENTNFLIYSIYHANDYRLQRFSITNCKSRGSEQLLELDDTDKYINTEPNQTYYVIRHAKTSTHVRENMIYTCPLVFRTSKKNIIKKINVDIASSVLFWPDIYASAQYSKIKKGSMQKIFVIMDSLSASGAKATLLSSNMIVTKIFNKSAIVEFDVEANKLGKNKYYIFTSAGDMKEITFEVVNREVGTISQSDASFSEGKINDIILDFSNLSYNFLSSANYFSYKIADVASEKRVLHAPLSNVIVPMLMTSSGIKLLSLSLFDANISNIFSFSKPIFIKSKSEVRIDKINFFSNGNGKNVVELFIKKDPAIKKVFLVINKQIYNLVSDSIIFSVENKTQSAKLTWVDSYNSKGDKAFLLRQTNGNDSVFSTTDFSPDNTQESLTFIIFLGLASLIILTFIDIIRNHSYLDRIFKK